jgi:conjugal transfer pilin signal peptidase TrbI
MKYKINILSYIVGLFSFALLFNLYFGFAVNLTNSLPYKLFVINKISTPSVGHYISFKAPLESGLPADTIITKKVLAGPGDIVNIKNNDFYINNKWVARAKTLSLKGEPLVLGPEGKLEQGQYYVSGQHPDSLDSRYQKMGWINNEQIVAVAYPIF